MSTLKFRKECSSLYLELLEDEGGVKILRALSEAKKALSFYELLEALKRKEVKIEAAQLALRIKLLLLATLVEKDVIDNITYYKITTRGERVVVIFSELTEALE
jgi:DNA-binding HxlR family transcriptional regulator